MSDELVYYDDIMGASILADKELLAYMAQYKKYIEFTCISTGLSKDILYSYGFEHEQNLEKEQARKEI